MAINPVDPSYIIESSTEVKKKSASADEKSVQSANDRIELSPEAKKLHEGQIQSKLSEIRGKVESGFYDSDEVINSVANSLVKVIQGK